MAQMPVMPQEPVMPQDPAAVPPTPVLMQPSPAAIPQTPVILSQAPVMQQPAAAVQQMPVAPQIFASAPQTYAVPQPSAGFETPMSPGVISFTQETDGQGRNYNDRILEMYTSGKSKVAIARELNLGVGEVKLVIDLYKNRSER